MTDVVLLYYASNYALRSNVGHTYLLTSVARTLVFNSK